MTNKADYVYAVHEKHGKTRFTRRSWDLLGKNKRGWEEVSKEEIVKTVETVPIPMQPAYGPKEPENYPPIPPSGEQQPMSRDQVIEELTRRGVKFRRNLKTENLVKLLSDENSK